jgi:hypothetical protein
LLRREADFYYQNSIAILSLLARRVPLDKGKHGGI